MTLDVRLGSDDNAVGSLERRALICTCITFTHSTLKPHIRTYLQNEDNRTLSKNQKVHFLIIPKGLAIYHITRVGCCFVVHIPGIKLKLLQRWSSLGVGGRFTTDA